jgi:hypothetical protein
MGNLLDFVAISYYTDGRKYVENSTRRKNNARNFADFAAMPVV